MRFNNPHDWNLLSQEAAEIGLLVMAKQRSIKELTELLAEASEEAETLLKKTQGGEDLTTEQQARWDELLDEDNGEIPKLSKELAAAKKIESGKKEFGVGEVDDRWDG